MFGLGCCLGLLEFLVGYISVGWFVRWFNADLGFWWRFTLGLIVLMICRVEFCCLFGLLINFVLLCFEIISFWFSYVGLLAVWLFGFDVGSLVWGLWVFDFAWWVLGFNWFHFVVLSVLIAWMLFCYLLDVLWFCNGCLVCLFWVVYDCLDSFDVWFGFEYLDLWFSCGFTLDCFSVFNLVVLVWVCCIGCF